MNRLRLVVALIGVLAAVAAVVVDDPRLTWAAIVILAVALLLRFVGRDRPGSSP
jgi:hypothetical protein